MKSILGERPLDAFGRETKGMVFIVNDSLSRNLTSIDDCGSNGQLPSASFGNQVVQIIHPIRVQESMDDVVSFQIRPADDISLIVEPPTYTSLASQCTQIGSRIADLSCGCGAKRMK